MKDIRKVKEMKEVDNVLSENPDKLVIVKVSGEWCGPCQVLKSTINNLPDEETKDVIVLEADVDEAEDLANDLGVRSIPAMVFYRNNREKELDRTVGLLTRDSILKKISDLSEK